MTRTQSPPKSPVELSLRSPIVHLIGPANEENPNRSRAILYGRVKFLDQKVKWQRATLSFQGRAVLTHEGLVTTGISGGDEAFSGSEHSQILEICNVDKELIVFDGKSEIEFGLHLPFDLPPTMRTKHGFVEYSLIAKFSAGTFKTARAQCDVTVKRHYLPNGGVVIPTNEMTGCKDWFEWTMEVPRAATFEQGEAVIAMKWSCEKERVEVMKVETRIEETEIIHFKYKNAKTSVRLPPKLLSPAIYTPPSFTDPLDTHFLRTPLTRELTSPHVYTPFVEISHRLVITFKFTNNAQDITMVYPIIVTDLPDAQASIVISGDDAVPIDLGLPEYWGELPKYEDLQKPIASS